MTGGLTVGLPLSSAWVGDQDNSTRTRLKFQPSLTRVLEVMADNPSEQIPPDRTTAQIAVHVLIKLVPFAVPGTGTNLAELLDSKSDLARIVKLKSDRKKETHHGTVRRNRQLQKGKSPDQRLDKSATSKLAKVETAVDG